MTQAVAAVYSPLRTYPIPQSAVAEAVQGFRWARAYDVTVPDAYQYTAALLASGGSVDATELNRLSAIHPGVSEVEGWNPGEPGYPCQERVLYSLCGGEPVQTWTEGIISSLTKQREADAEAALKKIDHDAAVFHYIGLCASADPDIIVALVRAPEDGGPWSQWDVENGSWADVDLNDLVKHEAINMDSAMTAELVSALENNESLALQYAEPVAFLPTEGVTASAAPDDVEEPMLFAIVDEIDTTAVLAAIQVNPGPEVLVREGGSWVVDPEFQDWFTSTDPPTLVAVGAELREYVLAQIDSYQEYLLVKAIVDATELDSSTIDPQSAMKVIERLSAELKEAKNLQQNAKDYDSDELRELYHDVMRRLGYDEEARKQNLALLSSATTEAEVTEAYDQERDRRLNVRQLQDEIDEMFQLRSAREAYQRGQRLAETELRLRGFEQLSEAPMTAAGGWDRNRGNAETLRRYWLRGRGAAKIRWGTKGDWRRCYRQLFKYMGTRAKGYCQLRHKEATALWTGDRAHRRGINSLKASGEGASSANPKAQTGIMVALYPPEELAKRLALPGGEPWEELHVTIAYLGDIDTEGLFYEHDLVEAVRNWAPVVDVQEGVYSGKGLFVGEDIPEGCCTILTVDINTLPSFHRSLVNLLDDLWEDGPRVRKNHGFTAHTTLSYGDRLDDVEISEPIPVRFEKISVVWGESRTDIILGDDD